MRRKILQKSNKNKGKLAIPLLIVALMVLSVLAYTVGTPSTDQSTTYGGHKFTVNQNEQLWETDINGQNYKFRFLPGDLNFDVEGDIDAPAYYLVEDPNANYSERDLSLISLAKFEMKESLSSFGKTVRLGFLTEYNGQSQIDCSNTSLNFPVLLFELSNYTQVTNQNDCIHISGPSGVEVVQAKDKFLYSILGID